MAAVLDIKPPGCSRLRPASASEPASGLLRHGSERLWGVTHEANHADEELPHTVQRSRRGKLVLEFPFISAKGNRAKIEIEFCSIVAARRTGHTLTLELDRPASCFIGSWHNGEVSTWSRNDFSAGEYVALEHTVTARLTAEMQLFCQQLEFASEHLSSLLSTSTR